MKNLKLTIAEAQEMLLMSQSSVYSWIDKGKLQSIDSPNGKLIVISSDEANQIRDLNLKSKRNKASKFAENKKTVTSQKEYEDFEEVEFSGISKNNEAEELPKSLTAKLILELKDLALEAGKYKQLEIIRNEEKENSKYWEEKFFELSAELNRKNEEILNYKMKISELEKRLETLENKGIFSGFFKKK